MSKKMWHKIFKPKSKTSKTLTAAQKLNKRGSNIYEDYQQQLNNELLQDELPMLLPLPAATTVAIATKQQQHQEQQLQAPQQQQLSTFSRVVNTFSLKRSTGNKSSESLDSIACNNSNISNGNSRPTTPKIAIDMPKTRCLSQVLIVVNTLVCNANEVSNSNEHFYEKNRQNGPMKHSEGVVENVAASLTVQSRVTSATATTTTASITTTNNSNNPVNHLHATNGNSCNSSIITNTNNYSETTGTTAHNNKTDKTDDTIVQSQASGQNNGAVIDEPVKNEELHRCSICNRTFNENSLSKHVIICEKMQTKKRKIFDSSRQRREGTDLATYVLPKNFGLPNAATAAGVHTPPRGHSPVAVSHHQQQHEQQIKSPQMARRNNSQTDELVRTATRTSLRKTASKQECTMPTNSQPQQQQQFQRDRLRVSERASKRGQPAAAGERCPHCDRNFGLKAYDRHVEWCKEKAIQANIKNVGTSEQNKAKERLEARKQYRPPNLKTKRSINRDKYSGTNNTSVGAEADEYDCPDSSNMGASRSYSMTSSMTSDRNLTKIPRPERSISNPRPIVAQRSFILDTSHEQEQQKFLKKPTSHATPSRMKKEYSTSTVSSIEPTDYQSSQLNYNDDHEKRNYIDNYEDVVLKDSNPMMSSTRCSVRSNSRLGVKLDTPVQHMKFEQLKGIVNSKGKIVAACQISIEQTRTTVRKPARTNSSLQLLPSNSSELELSQVPKASKSKSSTSLIRTARRQMRTKEHPSIDIKTIQQQEQDQDVRYYEMEQQLARCRTDAQSSGDYQQMEEQTLPVIYDTAQLNRSMIYGRGGGDADEHSAHQLQAKKLEMLTANTGVLLCRPKKTRRATATGLLNSTEPLRALPLPQENMELLNQSMHGTALPLLHRYAAAGETAVSSNKNLYHKSDVSKDFADNDNSFAGNNDIKVIKSPTRTFSRSSSKARLRSGLHDKYDPFLSAKRQLEDLCAPATAPATTTITADILLKLQTPPLTPHIPLKMSTSLTTPTSTETMQTPKTPQLNNNNQVSCLMTKSSSFRRTASLRGPSSSRRSPMLPSRPLFSHNYRPTIQRGLSDEGPISTNFLKPEEYDEMPVRSVCVNDFAITKSPRVVRRDTSASNRKDKLRINVSTPRSQQDQTPPDMANAAEERAKFVAKTDSLAIFLKYEHELEKLNAKSKDESVPTVCNESKVTTQYSSKELKDKSNTLNKQNSAKHLKLESLTIALDEAATSAKEANSTFASVSQLPVLAKTPNYELASKENIENLCNGSSYAQIRLEPIASKTCTPTTTKPGTPLTKATTPASKPSTPGARSTQLPALPQAQQQQQSINLHAIFGDTKPQTLNYSKERKHSSSSSDYIDPKLINKCDNLPVNLMHVLKSSDSSDTVTNEQHAIQSDTSSSECGTAPMSQLTKLLPLAKQQQEQQKLEQQPHKMERERDKEATLSQSSSQSTITHVNSEKRHSAEGRNLLKRKIRLGRNQFLYDASPEAEESSCCSADDEANRSSMEYDEQQFNHANYQRQQQHQQQQQQQQQQLTQTMKLLKTPPAPLSLVPTIPPIFDDFDFEEFLSSFENDDDEQFPLFKDCREFLMNRSTNKQRSLLTSNSSKTNNNHKHTNNTNNPTAASAAATTTITTTTTRPTTAPMTTPTTTPMATQTRLHTATATQFFNNPDKQKTEVTTSYKSKHFQFPKNNNNNNNHNHLLTSTPINRCNSNLSNNEQYLKQQTGAISSNISLNNRSKFTLPGVPHNGDADAKKREIFISIETEQNEHGRSPISPASLRHMVGNAQTHVEVLEIDGNENEHKFSKISDDDDAGTEEEYEEQEEKAEMLMCHATTAANDDIVVNEDEDSDVATETMTTKSSAVAAGVAQTMPPPPTMFQNELEQTPNVQFNNAKNRMQQMQKDFRQRTEVAIATTSKTRKPHTPSGDSDELSSIDGYPLSSSHSSRRGVSSKFSSDSAYGSLSRQRSNELATGPRHRSITRPLTATTAAAAATQLSKQQQPGPMIDNAAIYNNNNNNGDNNNYMPLMNRTRHFSNGSTSSGSDNSLPPVALNSNQNYQLQQQQQQQFYNCNANNSNHNNNNGSKNNNPLDPLAMGMLGIAQSTHSIAASHNSNSNPNSNSNSNTAINKTSMKMSKFCHECGAKFIIEQAKFCMDCGVRRVVL